MSIYRSAVNKPVTTALIFLAFAILGIFSLTRLPVDNFPDIESNVIMVMSSYPGASAEDVENNLTKVLENSLNGVSDLKNYYEFISALQERHLRPALEKLLPVMALSAWGVLPESLDFTFNPIGS